MAAISESIGKVRVTGWMKSNRTRVEKLGKAWSDDGRNRERVMGEEEQAGNDLSNANTSPADNEREGQRSRSDWPESLRQFAKEPEVVAQKAGAPNTNFCS